MSPVWTLGEIADLAEAEAVRRGHRLRPWTEGRDANGMKWMAVCRVCGATALAEYDATGRPCWNGNTQRLSCRSVLRKKARASERRAQTGKGPS